MTEDEMVLFSTAQVAAGYLVPERNQRGDGWLFERDHDRFVGWQLGRGQERERCAQYLRDAAELLAPSGERVNQMDRHVARVLATAGDELAAGQVRRPNGPR